MIQYSKINKIWKLSEKDANHVTAWSKGRALILKIVGCFASHITKLKGISSIELIIVVNL